VTVDISITILFVISLVYQLRYVILIIFLFCVLAIMIIVNKGYQFKTQKVQVNSIYGFTSPR